MAQRASAGAARRALASGVLFPLSSMCFMSCMFHIIEILIDG
jgi:hypothetical protein